MTDAPHDSSRTDAASVGAVALVALAIGLACTALDALHVASGTLVYAHPGSLHQPLWVAPQFIALITVTLLALRWFPLVEAHPDLADRQVFIDAAVMGGLYAASSLIGAHGWLGALVFLAVWLARLVRRPGRVDVVVLSVLAAIIGPAYEVLLIHLGAFHYAHPTVLGVPLWLPMLYLNAGPLLQSLRVRLAGRGQVEGRTFISTEKGPSHD